MTSPDDPVNEEFEARIQRAERGEAGAMDAFQRLVGGIRADRADRPGADVLARIVAMGAPRPNPHATADTEGRPWWQAVERVVATLVGHTAPGNLAGVRSGAATAEHLAFETTEIAVDLVLTARDGDRWLMDGVIEPIGTTAPTDGAALVAAFSIATDDRAVEATVETDGRFTIVHPGRPDRLIVAYGGQTTELRLDAEPTNTD